MRKNRKRHKPMKEQYKSRFFKEITTKTRSGKVVYISKEHHERIAKILHVIGKNEISIYGYIHNVLECHFIEHKEVITELYEENKESIF